MFARFSHEARDAIVLANDESDRLHHPWLGTEHLLLGLLRQPATPTRQVLARLGITHQLVERALIQELGDTPEGECLGEDDERALRAIGIDLSEVRARIEEAFGRGALDRARPGRCGVPMMPRLKQGLERAGREAGRGPIDTDHLLLGIVEVRGALAVKLLWQLEVTPDAVRALVLARRAKAG